jgi:hypothetical protein
MIHTYKFGGVVDISPDSQLLIANRLILSESTKMKEIIERMACSRIVLTIRKQRPEEIPAIPPPRISFCFEVITVPFVISNLTALFGAKLDIYRYHFKTYMQGSAAHKVCEILFTTSNRRSATDITYPLSIRSYHSEPRKTCTTAVDCRFTSLLLVHQAPHSY